MFVAQRIRYAAFVFLHSVLDQARSNCTSLEDLEWESLKERIPYTKSESLARCLEKLDQVRLGDHCEYAALNLPLFLAGCESDDPAQKFLILDRLALLEGSVGIGSIGRVREALLLIWQHNSTRDGGELKTNWRTILYNQGWELILS